MEPTEKAKELHNNCMLKAFVQVKCSNKKDIIIPYEFIFNSAKQCAIISCQEIIDNNKNIVPIIDYSPDLICSTQYWKKVIEKIKTL